MFAGAAAAAVVPAAFAGILLTSCVLGPAAARLAAGYADLPVGAGVPEIWSSRWPGRARAGRRRVDDAAGPA